MNKIQNAVNPIKKGLGAFFVNRKVKISCLILIWGLVIIQTYVNFMNPGALCKHAVFSYDSYKKSKEAITAFSVIEDNATDKILKGFGYYKTDNMSEGEKRKLLIDFAKRLGIIGSNVSSLAKANINYVTNSYTSSGAAANSSDDLYSLMTSKFNSRG